MHHHLHAHVHQDMGKRAPVPELTTVNGVVMSVVYVTAEPTFTGVIGDYSTVTDEGDTSTSQESIASTVSRSALSTAADSADQSTATSTGTTTSQSPNSIINLATLVTSTTSATSITSATSAISASVSAVHGISTSTSNSSNSVIVLPTATSDATSESEGAGSSDSSTSSGMSTGAKAGLAIGILCAIGVVAALCLIFIAKKRRQRDRRARNNNNEKKSPAAPIISSSPKAPRLSLRPVSRLVPEMMGGSRPKSRLSQGNMLTTFEGPSQGPTAQSLSPAVANAVAPAHHAVTYQPAVQENPFQDPENPFADPEKSAGLMAPVVDPTAPLPIAIAVSPDPTPIESSGVVRPAVLSTEPTAAPTPIPAPASSQPMSVPVARSSPMPAPVMIPAPGAIAAGAPSPVIAPGPGPDLPQGNVYRILMEFNPTMDDELGLRAGQHVRMLHEYDDGWALCIKLDRSQQGVVPRTCLAAKPSKPRPAPGPNGPQPFRGGPHRNDRNSPVPIRAADPNNLPVRAASPPIGTPSSSRPQSLTQRQVPAASRPLSPGAFNQTPRPLSPGPRPQKRSMSPGPYGANGPKPMAEVSPRRRSNSANALSVRERRNSPPGPSKLGPGLPPIRSDSPGLAM